MYLIRIVVFKTNGFVVTIAVNTNPREFITARQTNMTQVLVIAGLPVENTNMLIRRTRNNLTASTVLQNLLHQLDKNHLPSYW